MKSLKALLARNSDQGSQQASQRGSDAQPTTGAESARHISTQAVQFQQPASSPSPLHTAHEHEELREKPR